MNQQQLDILIMACSSVAAVVFLFSAAYFTVMEIRYKRAFYTRLRGQIKLIQSSVPVKKAVSNPLLPASRKNNLVARDILDQGEKQFFGVLSQVLPDCYIFPQVPLSALVAPAPDIRTARRERSVRRKLHAKCVDFVVCDKSGLEVIAIAEYHAAGRRDDLRRDDLLRKVGYRIERFSGGDTVESVKSRFDGLKSGVPAAPFAVIDGQGFRVAPG